MNSYNDLINCIRLLAEDKQPNTDIAELLYRHNCHYLLSKLKSGHAYTAACRTEAILNQVCIQERYTTCRQIFDLFQKRNIPYAVIKGAVLSQAAYGDIRHRKSGDIDLLAPRSSIDEIKEILLQDGFIQGRATDHGIIPFTRRELLFQASMSHQAAPFLKKTSNPLCPYVNVDVNMDIIWGESGKKTDMGYVLTNTEPTSICGVPVQKLAREMEFAALCLHHYKDMNSIYLLSTGSLKLQLFCDIYSYIRFCKPDISVLQAICEKLGICEYVYYCLFYTSCIFPDEILEQYKTALYTEKAEALLNHFGLSPEEFKTWEIPFFERLFGQELTPYFQTHLSQKDFEKIRMNQELM